MSKNGAPGGGRVGAVKQRSQVKNPKTGIYTKRDTETGRFMDGKADGTPFKGVRKEAGAQAVLDLRSVRLNGEWDAYWQYHRQQQHERLYEAATSAPEAAEAQVLKLAA